MTDKQIQHKARRKTLQELSKIAKMRLKMDCEGMTVNQILINEFYTNEENKEFKTLYEWNKEGYQIKKGSVSFLIWGKPKPKPKGTDQPQNQDEDEDEFFPLCYLFSNAQVIKKNA